MAPRSPSDGETQDASQGRCAYGCTPPSDTLHRAVASNSVFGVHFFGTAALHPLRHSAVGASTGVPWRHSVARLDNRDRVALGAAAAPGTRLHGIVADRRWVLKPDPDGAQRADVRGRLTVPAGLRWLLGGGPDLGLSWRDGVVVVWPASVLDVLAEGTA